MLSRLLTENIDVNLVLNRNLNAVRVDRSQIEQVIINLVLNARDAMPAGGRLTIGTNNIVLDNDYAKSHVQVTPGNYVLLAVSDTGTGMDGALLARIFEPFFERQRDGSRVVHGIGNRETKRRPYLGLQRAGPRLNIQGLSSRHAGNAHAICPSC